MPVEGIFTQSSCCCQTRAWPGPLPEGAQLGSLPAALRRQAGPSSIPACSAYKALMMPVTCTDSFTAGGCCSARRWQQEAARRASLPRYAALPLYLQTPCGHSRPTSLSLRLLGEGCCGEPLTSACLLLTGSRGLWGRVGLHECQSGSTPCWVVLNASASYASRWQAGGSDRPLLIAC